MSLKYESRKLFGYVHSVWQMTTLSYSHFSNILIGNGSYLFLLFLVSVFCISPTSWLISPSIGAKELRIIRQNKTDISGINRLSNHNIYNYCQLYIVSFFKCQDTFTKKGYFVIWLCVLDIPSLVQSVDWQSRSFLSVDPAWTCVYHSNLRWARLSCLPGHL